VTYLPEAGHLVPSPEPRGLGPVARWCREILVVALSPEDLERALLKLDLVAARFSAERKALGLKPQVPDLVKRLLPEVEKILYGYPHWHTVNAKTMFNARLTRWEFGGPED